MEGSLRYWKGEGDICVLQASVESVLSLVAAPMKKVVLSLEVAPVEKAVGQVALSLEAAL